jgi:TolB-like protein
MRKIAVMLLLLSGTLAAQEQTMTLDEAVLASGVYLAGRLAKGTVVVVSNFNAATASLSDYVIEELTACLVRDGGLKVAARRELELLYEEMDFQSSGEVSEETQQAIGYMLGAQTVISGSLTSVGSAYRMRIKAINVESAVTEASESWTIRRDERLVALLDPRQAARSKTWSDFRLELGARVGVSPRFYTLSDGIDGSASNGASFEGTVQLSALFLSFNLWGFPADLAAQMELIFTHDTVNYSTQDDDGEHSGVFSYPSLRIPILAGLRVGFDRFSLALFTGPHFTIPLGKMRYEVDGETKSFDCSVPMGWTVGVQGEMPLGPGSAVADIRYAGDFGRTSIDGAPGTLPVFSRGMLSFSVGYKFRLRF